MQVARRTRTWLRAAVVCGALLASAALALPTAQQAAARPDDPPLPAPARLRDMSVLEEAYHAINRS